MTAHVNESSTDRIEKRITLRAPRSRVWRALTDAAEFGQWFGVELEGSFVIGERIQGRITHPGCDKLLMQLWVERMDAEQLFSYRWHPHGGTPDFDVDNEPTTLIEFTLEDVDGGTQLTVIESGFDALPEDKRHEHFVRNEGGWTAQMDNIRAHLDA
jgi:uncharacterized protein YndB with AHSA1/START domain